jgi:uncharacterized protein (TIGR02001 family)
MRNLRILAAFGLIAAAGIAQADVSGTAAIVSDYDFRGFTQTAEEPAVQLSIDWSNDGGWYAGVWGSNIAQFSDGGTSTASTELDAYTGFKGGSSESFAWDVGIVYYTYEGASDLNYPEIYGKATFGPFTGALFYSNAFGNTDNDEAIYVSGDLAFPVGELTLLAHAGYSMGDGIEQAYPFLGSDEYFDYLVGVSYTASNITLSIKYSIVDSDDASDGRVILGVSTALPWK